MEKIIYIHGFGSSGNSESAQSIKEKIPDLLTPTYNALEPRKSLQELLKLVNDGDTIVASSLGGWYAERISERKKVKLVLYNPSVDPSRALAKYHVPYSVREDYKTIELETPEYDHVTPVTLILSIDDEVIYYRIAKDHYMKKSVEGKVKDDLVLNKGGHRIGKNVDYVINSIKKYNGN